MTRCALTCDYRNRPGTYWDHSTSCARSSSGVMLTLGGVASHAFSCGRSSGNPSGRRLVAPAATLAAPWGAPSTLMGGSAPTRWNQHWQPSSISLREAFAGGMGQLHPENASGTRREGPGPGVHDRRSAIQGWARLGAAISPALLTGLPGDSGRNPVETSVRGAGECGPGSRWRSGVRSRCRRSPHQQDAPGYRFSISAESA